MDSEKLKMAEFIGRRYGSSNPFTVTQKLGIPIEWVSFGTNLMGKVVYLDDESPIILLNEELRDLNEQYFVCAHELGHILKHEGLAAYYMINAKYRSKLEYAATDFAFYLLLNLYKEENGEFPETRGILSQKYGIPEQ